jgi:hypothetical protein
VVSMALIKYIYDVVVFHPRMARKGRNMLSNRQNKVTTEISVAIAGMLERYTYNITQQDAPTPQR